MVRVAPTKEILRKRVLRLLRLDQSDDDPSELRRRVLPFLRSLGEVALIGGAIRDVAREGRKGFSSDLDFVVHGTSREKFLSTLKNRVAQPNRFGGFALHFHHWKVDVWHLEDTWARTAGLERVEKISDLLRCTFFDWDSVVFDLGSGKLEFDDGYLRRLESGLMNVQLEENPNPAGSLVRALRRAALWKVRFGPQLTEFCLQNLSTFDWADLVMRDKAAFSRSILAHLDREQVVRRLEQVDLIDGNESSFPIPDWEQEPLIPFDGVDKTTLSPCV